jgi:hypothetical protein
VPGNNKKENPPQQGRGLYIKATPKQAWGLNMRIKTFEIVRHIWYMWHGL